jgi:hypothetical protein
LHPTKGLLNAEVYDYRADRNRFLPRTLVHADEGLTAFLELESAIKLVSSDFNLIKLSPAVRRQSEGDM